MKFIFPKNYNFKSKLFGVIDYSTAILNLFWIIFIYFLSNIFFNNLNIKIFFIITLCFPLLIFSIVGFNNENILCVIIYFSKYLFRPKLYLYNK